MGFVPRHRVFLYRGSIYIYLILNTLAKIYQALFPGLNYVVVPTIWGARFVLPKSGFAGGRYITIMLGLVEPQWRSYFIMFVSKARTFLDIGAASDGYYTVFASKINPSIRVIAIEPLRREAVHLARNIELNRLNNVILLKVALCKENKVAEISGEKTLCVNLDWLMKKLNIERVDIMKLDVEGMRHEILAGGFETIAKHKPIVFFEVHNSEERKAVLRLHRLGYRILRLYGEMYITIPKELKTYTKP